MSDKPNPYRAQQTEKESIYLIEGSDLHRLVLSETPIHIKVAIAERIRSCGPVAQQAPSKGEDCDTCLFSAQCRVIPYVPPCHNHGPDSPARAASQERDKIYKRLEKLVVEYEMQYHEEQAVRWSDIDCLFAEMRGGEPE